jgi:hypothetical protein
VKTVDEAFDHYFPLKKSGELSLKDIREELEKKRRFSDEEISAICIQISDHEMNELYTQKNSFFKIFEHIGFAYFNAILMVGIIGYCIYFIYWTYNQDLVVEVPSSLKIYPLVFIGGALTFFFRNYMRIRRHRRNRD